MKLSIFFHRKLILLTSSACLQVDTYEHLYDDVTKLDDIRILDKWFRVDSKPFKQGLLNIVKKWSFMFKQYLMDDVTNRYARDSINAVKKLFYSHFRLFC
jgi:hypothetical protein